MVFVCVKVRGERGEGGERSETGERRGTIGDTDHILK
jgi:hypothetical protein